MWELLGPATGAGFGLLVLSILMGCWIYSMRGTDMTQTDPRDPDFDEDGNVRDPDTVEQPDEVRDPAEPQTNPDEPQE